MRFVLRISSNALLVDAFPSRGLVMAKTTVMIHQTKMNTAMVSTISIYSDVTGIYTSAFIY